MDGVKGRGWMGGREGVDEGGRGQMGMNGVDRWGEMEEADGGQRERKEEGGGGEWREQMGKREKVD